MNFDYTYIVLFGHLLFEPMVVLTNTIFLVLTIVFFRRLTVSQQPYARQMAWFMLLLGISSGFGGIAHGAHYLLGDLFFDSIFFLTNAFSLLSIYFCFRAPYTYYTKQPNLLLVRGVKLWVAILMLYSLLMGEFVVIKIHAGIVLLYSLTVHYLVYRKTHEKGSRLVVLGILFSFLSIIVHSLKFSFSEWFNYKDIAHVIMIITLSMIYSGVKLNVDKLDGKIT